MTKTVHAKGLDDLVNQIVECTKEGLVPSQSVLPVGAGMGLKTRMCFYDILTMECAKKYAARGINGMVAMVHALTLEDRRIKSVTTMGFNAEAIKSAEFILDFYKAPVKTSIPVEEPEVKPEDSIIPTAEDQEVINAGREEAHVLESGDDQELETSGLVETTVAESEGSELTLKELKKLSKKKLLAMVQDKGLKGNIQESKTVLAKRYLGEEE